MGILYYSPFSQANGENTSFLPQSHHPMRWGRRQGSVPEGHRVTKGCVVKGNPNASISGVDEGAALSDRCVLRVSSLP